MSFALKAASASKYVRPTRYRWTHERGAPHRSPSHRSRVVPDPAVPDRPERAAPADPRRHRADYPRHGRLRLRHRPGLRRGRAAARGVGAAPRGAGHRGRGDGRRGHHRVPGDLQDRRHAVRPAGPHREHHAERGRGPAGPRRGRTRRDLAGRLRAHRAGRDHEPPRRARPGRRRPGRLRRRGRGQGRAARQRPAVAQQRLGEGGIRGGRRRLQCPAQSGPRSARGVGGRRLVTPPPPLLLAAHGTRDPAGVAGFQALAARVADLAGPDGIEVAGGFIELSAPPLRDVVTSLAGPGPARVVAVPLMLVAAGHAKGDIPAALAREQARHPGVSFTYARTLGPHPALIELLDARVAAVAGNTPAAVLVVGRGSTDPDANADVVKTARLLWEGRDYPLAETAFVSLARPDVAEGLERCRLLSVGQQGARRIVVARYFLFPGVLPDRVAEQAAQYAAAHPELDIACTDVLGDCDEIAALVWERYREALAGDIRMNCDVCV